MEIKPNRTSSYQFTADLSNPEDMEMIKDLRDFVSHNNRRGPEKNRVELKGRLGNNNPKAEKYRNRPRNGWGHPYQRIRLEDAKFADVYVYEVRQY